MSSRAVFQLTTYQPSSFHIPTERIIDTVPFVACISYKSQSTAISSCSAKSPTSPKTTTLSSGHPQILNLNTGFAHYRRDLITMYIVTKIPSSPSLGGLRGLGAFFHPRKFAINLCYKSTCLHCPIVLALRRVLGIGQRTKDDSNFSEYRISSSTSISLRGLGPFVKQTHLRNTTTVFTSTCTLQSYFSPRCSP
jgi:hypothetical protein